MRPLFLLPFLCLLPACGGATPDAQSPASKKSGGDNDSEPNVSIEMAAQGGTSALASSAAAGNTPMASGLNFEMLDGKVKLDGVPQEWPARAAANTKVKGSSKAKLAGALQYDAEKIWVAGEIGDPAFVDGKSHASLIIAFPSGAGSYAAYEVGLYPGKPGDTAGSVKMKGVEVPGAKIVEAPAEGGLTFEASIPWSAFAEASRVRVGMHGVLRYTDATGAIVATGDGDTTDAKRLPALPTEPEQSLIEGLLQPKGLSAAVPKYELFADVAGDGMKERITVFGSYFTICGPGYREGKEYFFRDLGAELVQLEARELTGRGKADLIVRRSYPAKGGKRENFEVWSILGAGEPTTTFAHEILVQSGSNKVMNSVHVGAKEIEVSTAPAVGWDVASYHEPVANDVEPVLLPWGAVKSRSFRFDGVKFARAKEVAQTPAAVPAGAHPESAGAPAPPMRVEPPTPPQKKGGDLAREMLDQVKKERGIAPDTKPKTDVQVHVAEDNRPERVLLIGRDIVVFGPGFKGGTGYAYLTLSQFESEADVREMTTRDINGDGAADLVVRGVRHVQAQGAKGTVDMEALFVYTVKDGAIARIFGIETAREIGAKRVQGLVQFVPAKSGKGFDVDVRPGRAVGWTEKTFPWGQEQPGAGALEPLLLPWGGIASLRYAWDGSKFTANR